MKKVLPILLLSANFFLIALDLKAEDPVNKEAKESSKILTDLYKKENPHPQKQPRDQPPYVKFEDVKMWKAAGDHHAAGYDENNNLIAIYDLTYQNTLSIEFFGRSLLGTIGAGDFNLRELIRMIRNAMNDRQPRSRGGSGPMPSEDYKKIKKTLTKIETQYGDLTSPLKGEWWSQIPIKQDARGRRLADPAVSFKLSDIDVDSVMDPVQKFTYDNNLRQMQANISEMFNIDATRLFEQLTIQRNKNGSFDLVLTPNAPSLAPSSQPDKVVDLVRYQNSFGYALLYLAIKTALTNIAGAIPQPVVAAIIKYAVNRWFELYEEQLSFHRFKAYEYINEAERGDVSPFSFMTADERARSGVYILSHEAGIFHTIFQIRDKAFYLKSVQDELTSVTANQTWTNAEKLGLSPLSPLYFYANKEQAVQNDYVLVMGGRPRFVQAPFIAVDYRNPYDEQIKRNIIKSVYDIMHAMQLPFPGIDFFMILLYDVFLMDDVRDAMRWEARLTSLMRNIPDTDFSSEIERIYAQRVNPFEFDLDEENAYVQRSKEYLGL